MAPIIDKVLGLRCASFGYQYGEIAGSLASVYFCGGDCVEDVTSRIKAFVFKFISVPAKWIRFVADFREKTCIVAHFFVILPPEKKSLTDNISYTR